MTDKPLNVTELKLTRVRRERPKKNIVRTIPTEPVLTCAATTPAKNLAKTIYMCLQEHLYCQVSALYEDANFKALIAISEATGMAAKANIDVKCKIGFVEPRPLDRSGRPGTGFVYFLTTNLIRTDDGNIVRTVY